MILLQLQSPDPCHGKVAACCDKTSWYDFMPCVQRACTSAQVCVLIRLVQLHPVLMDTDRVLCLPSDHESRGCLEITKYVVPAADFYMSLYNVVFTALMPLIVGTMDIDVNRESSRKYPGITSALTGDAASFMFNSTPSATDLDKYLASPSLFTVTFLVS